MSRSARSNSKTQRLYIVATALLAAACADDVPDFMGPPTTSILGTLVISNVATGGEFDVDGLEVLVDGTAVGFLDLNDFLTIRNVSPGTHSVELTGAAPNCVVETPGLETFTVSAGEVSGVLYTVVCTPSPELTSLQLLFSHHDAGEDGSEFNLEPRQIYAMNADGLGLTKLTEDEFDNYSPAVSADGKKIAFVSVRGFDDYGDPFPGDIYVMNADGTDPVTSFLRSATDPAWSPDGGELAFVMRGNGIWVTRGDLNDPTQLTQDLDTSPAWSPDGTRIVFVRNSNIWIMNRDGSAVTRLTDFTSDTPIWSPDGSRIAFSGRRTALIVMNADGSAVTELVGDEGEVHAGAWSSDGKKIVFTRTLAGRVGIYMANVDDGSLIRVTADRSYYGSPSFLQAGGVGAPRRNR